MSNGKHSVILNLNKDLRVRSKNKFYGFKGQDVGYLGLLLQ